MNVLAKAARPEAIQARETLSPEREQLAAAIQAHAEAVAQLEVLEEADSGSWHVIASDRRARDAAAADLEEAKRAAATAFVARARGAAPQDFPPVAEAQLRLASTEAALNASRDGHARLKADIAALRGRPTFLGFLIEQAAAAVLVAEAGTAAVQLAEKIERLQREMVDAARALHLLLGLGIASDDGKARVVNLRFRQMPTDWNIATGAGASPLEASWLTAIEKLRSDPRARLPT